jgi:hypothetical protein
MLRFAVIRGSTMNDSKLKQVINEQAFDLGAVLVAEFAPEEAELYPELIAAYRRDAGASGGDHPLGMGLGEIVSAVSPVLFEVGGVVVAGLWAIAKTTTEKSVEDAIAPRITDWIKRRFTKPAPLTLTDRQIEAILDAVESKVARMKLPREMKHQVVSAVRGFLEQGCGPRNADGK